MLNSRNHSHKPRVKFYPEQFWQEQGPWDPLTKADPASPGVVRETADPLHHCSPFLLPLLLAQLGGLGITKTLFRPEKKITFADQSVTENVQEQTGEETVTEAPLFFSRWPNAGKEWSLVQHSPLSSAPHPNLPIYVFVEPPALKPLPVQKQTGVGQHTHTHISIHREQRNKSSMDSPAFTDPQILLQVTNVS